MAMQFPAGQRTPEKYQSVGPNYMKWGEQEHNGYVYDPSRDAYYYDPKAAARYEADARKEIEGTPPGIWEQAGASALPTAATVGGYWLANHYLNSANQGAQSVNGANAVAQGASSGTNAAQTSLAAGEETNAAWNAGADAATANAASSAGGGTPWFSMGSPSYAGYGAAALEAANGLLALGETSSGKDKAQALAQAGALAVADVYTGGLASLAYQGLMRIPFMKKIDTKIKAFDQDLGYFSPTGALGKALDALGLGLSTKDKQELRKANLYNENFTGQRDLMAFADKRYAETAGDREQGLRFIDPNGVDSYKLQVQGRDVTLNPTYFLGEIAPMDLVKDDYMGKWTHQQRYEFNRRLLSENLYKSDHGGWEITDKERAAQIKADIDKMPSDPNWKSPESKLVKDPGIDNAYDANSPDNSPFASSSASSGGTQKAASGGGLLGLSSWDDAVKAGKARPGSKEAGGYVIGRQWYPSTAAVPV